MPYITTLGQKTYYEDDCFCDPFGPEPEVILIQPGYGRSTNFWYHWIPLLSTKFRVIRRDLRGHGRSSAPIRGKDYDWSLDTMLAEIIDMLDQLKIKKIHFIGESTSGELGIAFAVKYPERLHSLITTSSPSHLPPASAKFLALGHESWPQAVRTLGSAGWARELAKRPGTGARKDDSSYLNWWIEEVGKSPTEGLAEYAVFLEQLDVRGFLKDVKVPTLILAPTKSTAAPVEDEKMIHESIKGSKIEWIHGAGHEIYVDRASECIKAVEDFIASLKK